MKIQLWSVGKSHDPYVKEGIEDFSKRINKYFTTEWTIISPPKNAAALSEKDLKKSGSRLTLGTTTKGRLFDLTR